MKKNLFIFVVLAGLCILFTGCDKNYKATLKMNCSGENSTLEVKKNEKFTCDLFSNHYVFTVESVTEDTVTIKTSRHGLAEVTESGTISLLDNVTEFKVVKGKDLILRTQTEDYSEDLIITWK